MRGAAVVLFLLALAVVLWPRADAEPSQATTSSPAANGERVEAFQRVDGRLKPCPPLEEGGTTGCRYQTNNPNKVSFYVKTIAGDMRFARCFYDYSIQVDAQGRTMMDGMLAGTLTPDPCSDVRPCRKPDGNGWFPWLGRIERLRNGALINRVDACVDTCIGQFRGELVMRLSLRTSRLRAVTAPSSVGSSGFTIDDGIWDWKIPGLVLR